MAEKVQPPPIEDSFLENDIEKRVSQTWLEFFYRVFKTAVSNFTELIDVPTDYVGESGNLLRVKTSEDGLEYVTTIILVSGTTNEIEVTDDGDGTITIGLPDNVSITNDLTVNNDVTIGNDLSVTRNADIGNDASVSNDLSVGRDVRIGGDEYVKSDQKLYFDNV